MYARGRNGGRHGGRGGRGAGRGAGRGGRGRGHDTLLDTSVSLVPVLSYRPSRYLDDSPVSFVRAIVEETNTDELVLRLKADANLDRIDAVLESPCRVDGQRTFQTVFLPFVEFLTSPRFKQSLHKTIRKTLYRRVANEELFISRLVNCLVKERSALEALGLLVRGVSACADLFYQVCTNLHTLVGEDPFIYEQAYKLHEWILSNADVGIAPEIVALLDRTLTICEDFLPEGTVRPRYGADTQTPAVMDQYRVQPQAVRRVQRALADDRGPRHDNDDADYSRVQVLPTHEEISCLEDPRLPFYPDSDAPIAAVVDFHFRLVREDMLAQLRRGIQWFLGGPGLNYFHRAGLVEPPRHENIPRLLVCNKVELGMIGCHIRKGVFFTVTAAQPRLRGASTATERQLKESRREFWSGDRLSTGSLVALALGVPKTKATPLDQQNADGVAAAAYPRSTQLRAAHVFFGQVASRDERELLRDEQTITTHLKFAKKDTQNVLRYLRRQEHGTDSVLIEAAGVCFPPTEAILRTLQSYQVVQPPSLLEQIFCVSSNEIFTQLPTRTGQRPGTWTLQHLVRDEAKAEVDLGSVSITSFEELCALLHPLEQQGKLKLDGSQVEAFAAAMTRAVCLVQGPPGTGKSYVGVKIVETFLAQQPAVQKMPPILCVCYTNHALDQFLEDLVKSRACALHDIVRVGGRSKSETLQTRNLFHLESTETHDEHHTFRHLFKQCKEQEQQTFAAFNEKKSTSGSLLMWLRQSHSEEYWAIVGFDDDGGSEDDGDGWVTKDSRGAKPIDRWKSWLAGKTAPALFFTATSPASGGSREELAGVLAECDGDIWTLDKRRRNECADEWTREWLDASDGDLAKAMRQYEERVEQLRELNLARQLRVLRSSRIVGMTTTGCAKNQDLVRALAPKIVVCEEAGEVLEAHLLSCITPGIEQLIQIGDHQQLRPPVTEYKLSVPAGRGHNMDISLFERLVNDRLSLYSGNLDQMRQRGVLVTLQTQRRMRPEIADLVRLTLYPTLQDAPAVRAYPPMRGFRDNLWFFDHDHPETSNESSKSNVFEAEMVVELVAYALKQGYKGEDIAVLTPYLGQLRVIRRLLSTKSLRIELDDRDAEALAQLEEGREEKEPQTTTASVGSVSMQQVVRLSTVDNFQGDEATLVFISTVRCNKENRSGFLKISNRMNVMLSRARHGMVILGSSSTVRQEDRAEMFIKVLDILQERECIGTNEIYLRCEHHGHTTRVTSPNDIRNLTPDGGCQQPCQARLHCGHACPKMCHIDDPEHKLVRCLQPCDKQVGVCGHFCKQLCSDECVCTHVFEEKTRACGHRETRVTCPQWRIMENRPCTHSVQVNMPLCGHDVTLPCPTAREIVQAAAGSVDAMDVSLAYQCNHMCGGAREGCGHECRRKCGDCLEATGEPSALALQRIIAQTKQVHAGDCRHECDRAMVCGHYCRAVCHPAGECPPCGQACENQCSHSTCAAPCSAVCASCSESCDWTCPHTETTCPLPCGSPCIRLPCDERCGKRLKCGHQCPGLCGEACLPSSYCRECGLSPAHADDVVDMLTLETLGEHDPSESPLILLGCGHALSVDTLDGIMEISSFYEVSESIEGRASFTRAKALGTEVAQGEWSTKYKCPHCRFLIVGGIKRYGRVLKYAQARNGELKFLQEVMEVVTRSRQQCASASTRLNGAVAGDGTHKEAEKDVRKMYEQWKKLVLKKTPTEELMVKELSRLDRLELPAETLNLAAYRQVIMKQSLIHRRLELLRVFTLWLQAVAASTEATSRVMKNANAWQLSYHEVIERERELLTLCEESNASRSGWEARVVGVRLRCWFVLASPMQQLDGSLVETVKAEIPLQLDVLKSDSRRMQAEVAALERRLADEVLNEKEDAKICVRLDAIKDDIVRVAALEPLVEQVFRPAVFYQQMTADEKRSVQRAMGYAGNSDGGFGGFGGHWYACPNGHPYVITECGGAMEQGSCAECQAPIGGNDHRVLQGNTSAQAFFQG